VQADGRARHSFPTAPQEEDHDFSSRVGGLDG